MHELETLSAPALSRLIDEGMSLVVVPFGSIEHQARHLPIGADAIVADAVGREVAERLDAVLAPTVRIGYAEQHQQLTGTLTLLASTLTNVTVELAQSLARQGFETIVLLSTHGGNAAALDAAVAQLESAADGAVVCAPRGDVGPRPGSHSGAWLTSVMLALRADLVEAERVSGDLAEEVRGADARQGLNNLERFVDSIVHAVQAASATFE